MLLIQEVEIKMKITELLNKVFFKITKEYDRILFYSTDGNIYSMHHDQDCCENVTIDDINGDLDDLLHNPILIASEESNSDDSGKYDSATWTFYKLATIKGYVDIRWFGESNGYYSESVDIALIGKCLDEIRDYKITTIIK
jgi:hypothetical protein